MKVIPLFDRVLITPFKNKNITQSGITLAATESSFLVYGKITATGSNLGENLPMQVKKDDIVIFEEHSAFKVSMGEQTYYLIKQIDILAIVEEL